MFWGSGHGGGLKGRVGFFFSGGHFHNLSYSFAKLPTLVLNALGTGGHMAGKQMKG